MFWDKLKERKEKKMAEKHAYDVKYENVAVPEVHIHREKGVPMEEEAEGRKEEDFCKEKNTEITYDSVAVPEIHIKKHS